MRKRSDTSLARRRLLERGALIGAAALMPRAAYAQQPPMVTPMSADLTAEEIRSLLDLEPNATCGFVRVTFLSKEKIAPGGLPAPFADGRPLGSALYFLVTPHAPVRLHRIRNDQLYHYYLGDPLEVFLLNANGTHERIVVGPDLRAGERVQLLPRQHVPHGAARRPQALVPRRQHRMARRRAGRCRDRQSRRADGEVSRRRGRHARDRSVGASRAADEPGRAALGAMRSRGGGLAVVRRQAGPRIPVL